MKKETIIEKSTLPEWINDFFNKKDKIKVEKKHIPFFSKLCKFIDDNGFEKILKNTAKIKSTLKFIGFYNKFSEKYKMVLAGGAVRDLLLGKDPKDFDIFVLSKKRRKFISEKEYHDEVKHFKNEFENFATKQIKNFPSIGIFNFTYHHSRSQQRDAYAAKIVEKKGNVSFFVCSFLNCEVNFAHDLEKNDSFQIIFRPDYSSADELIDEFDFSFCQFYAIDNPKNNSLDFYKTDSCGPFFIKHADCALDGFCSKKEYNTSITANKHGNINHCMSLIDKVQSFFVFQNRSCLSEFFLEKVRKGKLKEWQAKQTLCRAFKFCFDKERDFQYYPKFAISTLAPLITGQKNS